MLRDVTNVVCARKAKKQVDTSKYKTEMCRNWIELGACQYGPKCNFAHGKEDLLNRVPANDKYKSKECIPFHEKGFCTYGQRCLFVHDTLSLATMDKPYQWTLLLQRAPPTKRLPVFQRLCPGARVDDLQESVRIETEARRYLDRLVTEELEVAWDYKYTR